MLELWGKEENPQSVFATDIKVSEFKCFWFHQKSQLWLEKLPRKFYLF